MLMGAILSLSKPSAGGISSCHCNKPIAKHRVVSKPHHADTRPLLQVLLGPKGLPAKGAAAEEAQQRLLEVRPIPDTR